MSFRSLASLRVAVSFAALLVLSACSDNRQAQLSAVETIDIPAANAGQQTNQNIGNPTLVIPDTFPVAEGDELTLVFSEEFDGPNIRPEVWFFESGDGSQYGIPGWGNNELQYYLPDNAMIVNGVLEITARRETVGDFNYTSARINTRGSLRVQVWPHRGAASSCRRARASGRRSGCCRRTAIMSAAWTMKGTTDLVSGQPLVRSTSWKPSISTAQTATRFSHDPLRRRIPGESVHFRYLHSVS